MNFEEAVTVSSETLQVTTSTISTPPLIDLRDVIKVYLTAAGDFTALKGINAQVQKGEFLGIIGKSGAGKSTLLNMITGVDNITTGGNFLYLDLAGRPEKYIYEPDLGYRRSGL